MGGCGKNLLKHLAVFWPNRLCHIRLWRAVGWRDLAIVFNFRKRTHSCRSAIFLEAQFQKIGKFGHTRTSFHFQKITKTINFFFLIANIFLLLKVHSPPKKIPKHKCLGPKISNIVFDLVTGKTNVLVSIHSYSF